MAYEAERAAARELTDEELARSLLSVPKTDAPGDYQIWLQESDRRRAESFEETSRDVKIPWTQEETLKRAKALVDGDQSGRGRLQKDSERRYKELSSALGDERAYWERYRDDKNFKSVAARQIQQASSQISRQTMGAATGGTYAGGGGQLRALREGMFSGERVFSAASEQAAIARIQEENARQALAAQNIQQSYITGNAIQGSLDQANIGYGNLELGNDQLAENQRQFNKNAEFAMMQYKNARSDADRNFWVSVINGIVQTGMGIAGMAVGGPAGAAAGYAAGGEIGKSWQGSGESGGGYYQGSRASDWGTGRRQGQTYQNAPIQGTPAPVTYGNDSAPATQSGGANTAPYY